MRAIVNAVVLCQMAKKVKSNYFIVCSKIDQRAVLLSLSHLRIFAVHTH